MNIFILDNPQNVDLVAQSHCDKHVSKMILESAQMLCTATWDSGYTAPYKAVHQKHPCTLWAGASQENWLWLKELTLKLNEEFCWRYGRSVNHKSADVVKTMSTPDTLPLTSDLLRPQCMPEEYKVNQDPVSAYRKYYLGEKHFAMWTKRKEPEWWIH
jgi:hypothetical protein